MGLNLEQSQFIFQFSVFISQNPRTGEQLGQHYTTPVNPELVQRQVSQEGMLAHRDRSRYWWDAMPVVQKHIVVELTVERF